MRMSHWLPQAYPNQIRVSILVLRRQIVIDHVSTRRFCFMRRASSNLVNLLRAASPAGAEPHENPTSHLAPDGADPYDSPGPTSCLVPDVTQVPAPSTSHQGSFASVTCPIDVISCLRRESYPQPFGTILIRAIFEAV